MLTARPLLALRRRPAYRETRPIGLVAEVYDPRTKERDFPAWLRERTR